MTNTTAFLVVLGALGAGAALAIVIEPAEPQRSHSSSPAETAPASAPSPPPALAHEASDEELKLWNDRGCVTCHGPDGRGTEMGPDVIDVLPLYTAKYSSRASALQPLAAYIFDPKASPKLRAGDDGEYRSPMPGIVQLPGGTRDEAVVLAGLLLRLAR